MKCGEVLRLACDEVGVKKLAKALSLAPSLIYRWFQQENNNQPPATSNPLWRVAQIYEITGDPSPIEWLCERAGGCFVENVSLEPSNGDQQTKSFVNEFSDLLRAISVGLSEDRISALVALIDAEESDRIRKEWEALKRAGESFVIAAERA
jgi:hypothetical protein